MVAHLLYAFHSIFVSWLIAVCSLDCGPNGVCESGKCRCNPGYVGNLCDQLPCDPRCAEHGQCKNGTCVCSQGWNGRHCTLRKYLFNSYSEMKPKKKRTQKYIIFMMKLKKGTQKLSYRRVDGCKTYHFKPEMFF